MPFVLSGQAKVLVMAAIATAVVFALLVFWIFRLRRAVAAHARQLYETRQEVRTLFDAMPDLILVKDQAGRIIAANRRKLQVGERSTEILGRTAADLLPDIAGQLAEAEKEVLGSGTPRTVLVNRLDDSSRLANEEINVVPLRDQFGNITRTLSVVRNVTDRIELENRLRIWAHAVQHASFGISLLDFETGAIRLCNDSFAAAHGYQPQEMAGRPVADFYPADLRQEELARIQSLTADEHQISETEHIDRNGRRFPLLLDRSLFRDAAGQPKYVVMYAQDISERKRLLSELRLAAVSFETHDATMVLDERGMIQRVNSAFIELTGYAQEQVAGKRPFFLTTRTQNPAFFQTLYRQMGTRRQWRGELWVQVADGKPRVVRANMSTVSDINGAITHYVCAFSDVTDEQEAHARARRLNFFDTLTNLPNRNQLLGQLDHLMSADGSFGGVLLIVDLDHFKRVNELRGHTAGDQVLVQIAMRLERYQDSHTTVARLSGGVFAWLSARRNVSEDFCERQAGIYAGIIRKELAGPIVIEDGDPVAVTASIGWSCFVPGNSLPEKTLQEAELAMYAAKAAGRDQVRQFDPVLQEERARREALLAELRAAAADPSSQGMFVLAQPQFDEYGRIMAAELLLRWRRSNGELISPAAFIPLAEQNGLIEALGAWVLGQACTKLAAWVRMERLATISLSVNVSPHQFTKPDFLPFVRQTLERFDIDPSLLTLEVTESALFGDLEEVATRLRELRTLGLQISLDDFGTGYSSLSYVSHLPIDELKIDRAFVGRLPDGATEVTVAKSMIALARGLGSRIVAEGVETDSQRDWLVQHGCDLLQGHLLARPIPLDQFENLLGASAVT